jgi:hypothetical protein
VSFLTIKIAIFTSRDVERWTEGVKAPAVEMGRPLDAPTNPFLPIPQDRLLVGGAVGADVE